MIQESKKTVSGEVLLINGVLAGSALAAGLVSYLLGLDWVRERPGGMFCLYSVSLLAFMAAVYVADRLWRAQAFVDMLSALGLPQLLAQSRLAGRIYKVVLTVLLWIALAAASLLPDNAILAVAVIPMIIVWLAFVRLMAKAEQALEKEIFQPTAEEPLNTETAEKRSLVFWGAWLVFMLGVLYKLGWGVLHLHKYQWVFDAMPIRWQSDGILAVIGAGLGLLAALLYTLIVKVRRAQRKRTLSE